MELPRSVVFKSSSNGKYICHVQEDGDEQTFLEFCGEDVFSPVAKYEIEDEQHGSSHHGPSHRRPSQHWSSDQAKLVHIRCCYNNKYWVRHSEDKNWIVAKATRPEEDRSKWSCTLFEPIFAETNNIVQFRHVQLQRLLSMEEGSLSVASTEPAVRCVFIDWDLLLKLPSHIAFKGDNGRYLSGRQIKDSQHNYMHFTSEDKGERAEMNEVFVTGDGYIRIKSRAHDKFWRRDPKTNWILADSDDDPSGKDLNVLFKPVEISDKVIALRNLGNNLFCRRLPSDGKKDCLSAAADNITTEAHLELEEPLQSRTIEEKIKLRPMDGRIHNINSVVVIVDEITNKSNTESVTEELDLSHIRTQSGTWSSTVSKKLGLKATIKAGIPTIVSGNIEISGERSRPVEWGKTESASIEIKKVHKATVPPRSTVKAIVWAEKGSFEVPFSYTQCDTLTTGEKFSCQMDDGVYIGEGHFDFKETITQQSLD